MSPTPTRRLSRAGDVALAGALLALIVAMFGFLAAAPASAAPAPSGPATSNGYTYDPGTGVLSWGADVTVPENATGVLWRLPQASGGGPAPGASGHCRGS